MKLVLKKPISPYEVVQGFGVNGEYYRQHGINIDGHNGLDLRAYHGQPVYAAHDGTCYPEVDDKGGHGVVIISDQKYDYLPGECFFKTIYWHLVDGPSVVQTGQKVKAGDLIGYADNTGLSTGDHLHFGLKPVLKNDEPVFSWTSVNPNNGYLGAINPVPYLELDNFEESVLKVASQVVADQTQPAENRSKILEILQFVWKKLSGSL